MAVPIIPSGEPEVVGFEGDTETGWLVLKLKDGTVIRFKVIVTAVLKVGNDPNTGMPVYAVQTQGVVQLVNVPKELIKKPGRGGTPVT
ncbi:MAG: hypothetical protein OWQ54_01345 [Sulfolobaceae archaeon]|nr:hypothetical protein [Sulfolobaceae archaeon]